MTADSLVGGFGERCAERALEFLDQGWVSVIASDAHDTEARPPRLKPGLEVATRVLGAEAAQRLVAGLPNK